MTKLTLPSFLVMVFVRPAGPVNQKYKKMQNKPNFLHFCAENHDSTQKQTQNKPNSKPFSPSQRHPKPNQTQNKPNLCRPSRKKTACGITKFRKAKNNNYEVEKYENEPTK